MEERVMDSKRVWYRVGLALFFMSFATLAVQYGSDYLVNEYMPAFRESGWYVWVLTALSVVGVGFPVFYLIIRKAPSYNRGEVVRLKPTAFIAIFFICVAVMYITNFISVIINLVIALFMGKNILNPLEQAVIQSNFIMTFLYGAILGPIVEELIFRKYLLDKVRPFGDVTAILFTGIAFGLFHMNLSQFFYASALGIVFAYVTVKTNTIKYSILLHIFINFIGAVIAPYIATSNNLYLVMLMGLWVLASIAIGVVFLILYLVKNSKNISLAKAEVEYKKYLIILNPGFILFFLLTLYMTINVILQ